MLGSSPSHDGKKLGGICYAFAFEICFVPQRHALFRHLNFQTCSDTEVVCTFYTFVLSKMISHNMTLEIDLLWALRAAIPQGKLEWGESEKERKRERERYL